MRDAWGEPGFAQAWDRTNAWMENPDRDEQIDLLVTLLEGAVGAGGWVLDLGVGAGQVEERIFARIPGARVVRVDSSPSMLALERGRLATFRNRFETLAGDAGDLDAVSFPHVPYAAAISSQVFYEIPHERKRAAFARVFGLLAPGGAFYILDRVTPDFRWASGRLRLRLGPPEPQGGCRRCG